jgi:RNA polymerase sigma-70 factor (ECF subfamily)
MVSMGESDRAPIEAVLAGDKEAYGTLVKRHSQKLFRLAYRITGNEADADDVVQESFLRGYLNLKSFKSRSDFGTWIYRIAVHCALDRISSRSKEETNCAAEETDLGRGSVQIPDLAPGPERLALSAELGALEDRAMNGLTAMERTAFVLRHMEQRSTEEIAAALEIQPNAAKQTVFRAVQKVRQRLEILRVTA